MLLFVNVVVQYFAGGNQTAVSRLVSQTTQKQQWQLIKPATEGTDDLPPACLLPLP